MSFLEHTLRPLLAALAVSSAMLSPAGAAPTLAITGPASVALGSSFTLEVTASDVADLYGFQFDVTFNPVAFRADGVDEGGWLPAAGSTFFDGGSVDNAAGSVSFTFGTLIGAVPGASGSGVLASLRFSSIGVAPGIGTFGLANVSMVNSSLGDIGVGTAALNVSAVPEPATWGLLLAGLGGVLAVARRRPAAVAG